MNYDWFCRVKSLSVLHTNSLPVLDKVTAVPE